jgi:hypothetical protein
MILCGMILAASKNAIVGRRKIQRVVPVAINGHYFKTT